MSLKAMATESGVAPNEVIFAARFRDAVRLSGLSNRLFRFAKQQQKKEFQMSALTVPVAELHRIFLQGFPLTLLNVFCKLSRHFAVCPAVKRLCVLSEKKVART